VKVGLELPVPGGSLHGGNDSFSDDQATDIGSTCLFNEFLDENVGF